MTEIALTRPPKTERINRATAFLASLAEYVRVVKPRSTFLLAFTALGAMIVTGQRIPLSLWVKALVTIIVGCAGANVLNSYIDRDIDAMMERTRNRPLPQRTINPPERALAWGLILAALSLVLSWTINLLAFACIAAGILDDVVVYGLLTKRRTPLNIMLGAVSGGLPTLFGWSAVTGNISPTAILMGILVLVWTPNHIWNLALRYRDDYKTAGVPMLPVVHGVKRTVSWIVATVVLTLVASLLLWFAGGFGPLYLVVSLAVGLPVVVGHLYLLAKPTPRGAWVLFKLSSPYLFALFLGMILDRWVSG